MDQNYLTERGGQNRPLAIETQHLTYAYKSGAGIDDVCLRVPAGAVYGFLGPNGAGKTTTIRLLLGLLAPQHGRIEIGGAYPAGKKLVGSMVEGPSLYPHLTGPENLSIGALLLGASRQEINELLDLVGLQGVENKLVKHYSLGMRQRLGIAQALLGDPEILILDEPSNGLDPSGMAEMRSLIQNLVRQRGKTVLLSSHLLDDVAKVASHIGVIHNGKFRWQGPISDLNSQALRLECADEAKALSALIGEGFSAEIIGQRKLKVDASPEEAPAVCRSLVSAGVDVFYLAPEKSGLDAVFDEMTRSEGVA